MSVSRPRSRLQEEDDDLYSYFNKSVSAVQAHADHFEQEYARPALRTSQAFFDERPIAADFFICKENAVIHNSTSRGLSIFAVTSFTIMALTSTVIASATVVLTLLSLLVLTLLITLVSAGFLTLSGVSIYSFASLLGFVHTDGRQGVSKWMQHMSDFLLGSISVMGSPRDQRDTEWTDDEGHEHEFDDGLELDLEPDVKQEEVEPKLEEDAVHDSPFDSPRQAVLTPNEGGDDADVFG
ncbi:hypothetical protein H0H81_000051 [Sphagnurus paluster]|uniref:Uncharacterized protein n=1 Tax=Sphagnurus paluster TaxID=117069 RepID=A0A9P7FYP6_9AGAR|nr:hypothetical protein H0H81_000051 [Sphagnurus paluster]